VNDRESVQAGHGIKSVPAFKYGKKHIYIGKNTHLHMKKKKKNEWVRDGVEWCKKGAWRVVEKKKKKKKKKCWHKFVFFF
jgi:hypothetical protein